MSSSTSSPARGLNGTLITIPGRQWMARAAWAIALVVGGVTFLALTAQIRIVLPFTPVPITGSTLGVLLVGSAYGTRLGGTTMLAYILAGIAGVPVFAGGKFGIAVLTGATGGYIFGYVIAALIVGWLAERRWDRSPWTTVIAMVVANVAIYTCGVVILARVPSIGWSNVLALGVLPFLLGDAIKIAIAAAALPTAWRLKERVTPR